MASNAAAMRATLRSTVKCDRNDVLPLHPSVVRSAGFAIRRPSAAERASASPGGTRMPSVPFRKTDLIPLTVVDTTGLPASIPLRGS